jgi:hypothetical protein
MHFSTSSVAMACETCREIDSGTEAPVGCARLHRLEEVVEVADEQRFCFRPQLGVWAAEG